MKKIVILALAMTQFAYGAATSRTNTPEKSRKKERAHEDVRVGDEVSKFKGELKAAAGRSESAQKTREEARAAVLNEAFTKDVALDVANVLVELPKTEVVKERLAEEAKAENRALKGEEVKAAVAEEVAAVKRVEEILKEDSDLKILENNGQADLIPEAQRKQIKNNAYFVKGYLSFANALKRVGHKMSEAPAAREIIAIIKGVNGWTVEAMINLGAVMQHAGNLIYSKAVLTAREALDVSLNIMRGITDALKRKEISKECFGIS